MNSRFYRSRLARMQDSVYMLNFVALNQFRYDGMHGMKQHREIIDFPILTSLVLAGWNGRPGRLTVLENRALGCNASSNSSCGSVKGGLEGNIELLPPRD